MGWGSSSTQQSNQQQNQQGSQSGYNMPIQLPWAAALQSGLAGGPFQQLLAGAEAPVYGTAQKADYLSNLNELANAATKNLSSTLASRGGTLNSGAFAAGESGIQQQRLGQAANFFQNLPFQEAAAKQQRLTGAIGVGNALAASAPMGNAYSGQSDSSGTSSGTTTTTQNPGFGSLLGGLLGVGLSGLTGGLFSGGGIGMGNTNYNPFQTSQGVQMPFTGGYNSPAPPVNWAPTF